MHLVSKQGNTHKQNRLKNIYKTENGEIVYYKNSKNFAGSSIYWYLFHIIEMYNRGVNKVSFTVAHNGVIILPISLLLEYAPYADYNEKKYHYIRIKCLRNRYYHIFYTKTKTS